MVGDNLEDIRAFTTVSDLFLLYMSDDVTDHADVVRNLLHICDTITDAGKRLIIIGAEKVVKLHPEGYILKSITRDQLVATLEDFFRSGVINTLFY